MKIKFYVILSIIGLIHCSCWAQIDFGPQQIIDTLPLAFIHVHSGDLDGDGDNDIVAAYQSSINWYRNNGNGGFSDSLIIDYVVQCQCVYLEDLDGDNDLDVLADMGAVDKFAWYQNDGNGNFSSRRVISDLVNGPHCVYAEDLDGDGYNDVLSASVFDDKIAWYRNDGNGNFGDQLIISSTTDMASTVYAADIDGDNDNDVIAGGAYDNTIAWYENLDGLGTFGIAQVVTTNAVRLQFAYAADLDGDMDNDIYFASLNDDKIAWVENDGFGNFGSQHLIDYEPMATDVCAYDLDCDGDLDIAASSDEGTLSWYENNGIGEFSSQRVISSENCRSVNCCDLNGDGFGDVISASVYMKKLSWYENLGIVNIDEKKLIKFSIFPNPTYNLVTVTGNNIGSIIITDITGKIIQNINSNSETITVDLTNEKKGIYFFKIFSYNSSQCAKVVLY